jgi:hypothetical protein
MNLSTDSTTELGTDAAAGPEAEDPWTGHTWWISVISKGLEELLIEGQLPQFRLERRPGKGPAVYALKPVTPIALPACFAPSILLTHCGTVLPGPLKCEKPLAASFVTPHDPYWNASEQILCDERDLLRLEGVIEMSDGAHTVSLYQADDVLTDGKLLLVVDFKSLKSKSNSDGTAVGHN